MALSNGYTFWPGSRPVTRVSSITQSGVYAAIASSDPNETMGLGDMEVIEHVVRGLWGWGLTILDGHRLHLWGAPGSMQDAVVCGPSFIKEVRRQIQVDPSDTEAMVVWADLCSCDSTATYIAPTYSGTITSFGTFVGTGTTTTVPLFSGSSLTLTGNSTPSNTWTTASSPNSGPSSSSIKKLKARIRRR